MMEIIRITADRKTLYMRIPGSFKRQKGLKRGDYLVCNFDGVGELKIHTWDDEKNAKSRTKEH